MKKYVFAIYALISGVIYICHIAYPISLWVVMITLVITGTLYVFLSALKKTDLFHMYVGWGWCILPILTLPTILLKRNTDWNVVTLLCIGISLAVVFLYFWKKDKNCENDYMDLKSLGIGILVTSSVIFCLTSLNEAVITDVHFYELTVKDKYIYDVPRSPNEECYVVIEIPEINDEKEIFVSEVYYSQIDINDKIKLCCCKGGLKVEFFFLYEDSEFDPFFLNKWAKGQEKKYNLHEM